MKKNTKERNDIKLYLPISFVVGAILGFLIFIFNKNRTEIKFNEFTKIITIPLVVIFIAILLSLIIVTSIKTVRCRKLIQDDMNDT